MTPPEAKAITVTSEFASKTNTSRPGSRGVGLLVFLIAFAASLLSACAPKVDATTSASIQPTVVVEAGVAILDWDTATILLPLDKYGLTLHEAQIVDAAGSIEYAKCLNQTDSVKSSVIQEAKRYLSTTPMASHWLYGWWDVAYISKNGYRGVMDTPLAYSAESPERRIDCFARVHNSGLTSAFNGNDTNGDIGQLSKATFEAYDRMTVYAPFLALQSAWRNCVSSQGYQIDYGYDTAAAFTDPSWSDEQYLRAALADAHCADHMGYTQQVGDINAAYQMQYINEHEAELVQIRKSLSDRVAKATVILSNAGVL